MLGDGPEAERGGLLVEAVLFGERVDELGEDFVLDDCLREVVTVVGETAKRERGALLDAAGEGREGKGSGLFVSLGEFARKKRQQG